MAQLLHKADSWKQNELPFFWMLPGLLFGVFYTLCVVLIPSIQFKAKHNIEGGEFTRLLPETPTNFWKLIKRSNTFAFIKNGMREKSQASPSIPDNWTHNAESCSRGMALPLKTSSSKLLWPHSSTVLTSPFGWRKGHMHSGVDIRASYASPIMSAHDGQVVYSKYFGSYGNLIAIKGSGKFKDVVTLYTHLQQSFVRKAQYVKAGTLIGRVGTSGRTSGPHLHFELRMKNISGRYTPVNPLRYFK